MSDRLEYSLDVVDAERTAALADAAILAARVRLYLRDGPAAADDSVAGWHRPGVDIVPGDRSPERRQTSHANAPENRDLHRMVLWHHHDAATLAALMRHELEHARQWDALGRAIFDLQDLVLDGVLGFKAGGLEGCAGALVNATPLEHDCNAAAAVWLGVRHPGAVSDIPASDRRQLACSLVGPEPFGTLPRRTIAFLAQFPAQCRAYGEKFDANFPDLLESYYAGAGDLWRSLASGAERLMSRR